MKNSHAPFLSLVIASLAVAASHPVVAMTAADAPDAATADDGGMIDANGDDAEAVDAGAEAYDAGCVGAACAPAKDPPFCDNDRYCVCCTGGTAGTSGVRPPYFWSYPGDCRDAGYIIRPEFDKDLCFD
jgi:hypothetical protein